MLNFELSPVFRSAIDFDRLPGRVGAADAYPPYDIQKLAGEGYRIRVAVAGFAEADLSVEQSGPTLTVTGRREDAAEGVSYLHRGIAGRSFVRRFRLAEHVEVRGAALADGVLNIELAREVPDSLKPRRIEIGGGAAALEPPKAA